MDDNKIIELFFSRDEQAIAELDKKYGKVCFKVSHNILNNTLDAEECLNDAYLGVWNAIPPARPSQLLAFVCRIVRNLSITRYHANTAIKRNSKYDVALDELENCLVSEMSVESEIEESQLASYIESFLDGLSKENRVVFMRRYWFSDSYSDISKLMGISEKNVSVRLVRIKNQLRRYLTERGVLI